MFAGKSMLLCYRLQFKRKKFLHDDTGAYMYSCRNYRKVKWDQLKRGGLNINHTEMKYSQYLDGAKVW